MSTSLHSLSGLDLKDPKVFGGPLMFVLALILLSIGLVGGIRNASEKRALQDQVDSTRHNIAQIAQLRQAAPEELRREIAQNRAQLRSILEAFPNSMEAMAEISTYYTLAARHEAEIVRLESVTSTTAMAPDSPIREESYVLEAQGAIRNLLRLLTEITNAPFETFLFRDLTLNEDSPAWAEMMVTVLSTDLDWSSWEPIPPEETP